MAHRFAVNTVLAVPWMTVRDRYDHDSVQLMESAAGADPTAKWMAFEQIAVGNSEGTMTVLLTQ